MPRRCLDCDTLRDDGQSCPACGSATFVVIDQDDGLEDPTVVAAWILLAHAMCTVCAVDLQPGPTLGTGLFAEGLVAVGVILGADKLYRVLGVVIAMTFLIHLWLCLDTGQWLLFGISAAARFSLLAIVAPDVHRPWVFGSLLVSVSLTLAVLGGSVADRAGAQPPGWWLNRHLWIDRHVERIGYKPAPEQVQRLLDKNPERP